MNSNFAHFYLIYITKILGWPKKKSFLNPNMVIDSYALDHAIEQMIDWGACIGSEKPDLALKMVSTMYRGYDWADVNNPDLITLVTDFKTRWEKTPNDEPVVAIKPMTFRGKREVVLVSEIQNDQALSLFEQYLLEALLWGMLNPQKLREYFGYRVNERLGIYGDEYQKYGFSRDEIEYLGTIEGFTDESLRILHAYCAKNGELEDAHPRIVENAKKLGISVYFNLRPIKKN